MKRTEAIGLRLSNQLITEHQTLPPGDVVGRLGAMQAQDLPGAKWSIGLRSQNGITEEDIDRAIAERRLVRTWPMRGTLHFVAPDDVRWMLALSAPRMLERTARRRAQLELNEEDLRRAAFTAIGALSGGRALVRAELLAEFEAAGVSTASQRGYHLLYHLSQTGVLILGPIEGKQQTFVLLDEWLPPSEPIARDDAVFRIAERFFRAHGPARAEDLARWAGLKLSEARQGLSQIADGLESVTIDGALHWIAVPPHGDTAGTPTGTGTQRSVYLLPAYDEYLMGYADRRLIFGGHYDTHHAKVAKNGVVAPAIISRGEVVGSWKREVRAGRVRVVPTLFRALTKAESTALAHRVEQYARFLGVEVRCDGVGRREVAG